MRVYYDGAATVRNKHMTLVHLLCVDV